MEIIMVEYINIALCIAVSVAAICIIGLGVAIWSIFIYNKKDNSLKGKLYLMMGDRASEKGKRKVSNQGKVN